MMPNFLSKIIKDTHQFFKFFFIVIKNVIINIFIIHRQYLLLSFMIIVVGAILFLGSLIGFLAYKLNDFSDISGLDNYGLYEVPSIVYDTNLKPIKVFSTHQREIISYEEIPQTIIDTLLLAEDRVFFTHNGVNILGITRALITNILYGRVVQGGSTITQQLAKLLFTNRQRSLTRKLKELVYTLQIEKQYSKEEILEKYLNKVYYANGVYSIAAASRFYFGLPIQKINYAQAALLISIPPNPTFYNPLTRPINVKDRQNVIMNLLIKANKITEEEAERQINELWDTIQNNLLDGTYFSNKQKTLDLSPYFSEYVRRILFDKYGQKIYTDGYKIYTTIDIDLQQAAEKAIQQHITNARESYQQTAKQYYKRMQSRITANNPAHPIVTEFLGVALGMPHLNFYLGHLGNEVRKELLETDIYSLNLVFSSLGMNGMKRAMDNIIVDSQNSNIKMNEIEGALISMEVNTGRILSMVGGFGFTASNQINRTYQSRRQPGSVFKPFVYLAALNSGRFTAATTFNDRPIGFSLPDGGIWTPGNSARNYQGEVTLRYALRRSINIVSIRLLRALGINQAVGFISSLLGIDKNRFRFDSSLALGTNELSPLEVNKGYAIIANGGKEIEPYGVISVRNRYNQVIDSPEDIILNTPSKQLVDPRYNYILTSMMQDIFRRGTATAVANRMNFPLDNVAGKTGTTSNMSDAWFSGFNSRVATTVWVGFDQRTSLGYNGFGAVLAAPIWIEYMKEVIKKYPNTPFIKPSGVISAMIHMDNGLLMPSNCYSSPQLIEEFFTQETLPVKYSPYCDKKIDAEIRKTAQTLNAQDIFGSL